MISILITNNIADISILMKTEQKNTNILVFAPCLFRGGGIKINVSDIDQRVTVCFRLNTTTHFRVRARKLSVIYQVWVFARYSKSNHFVLTTVVTNFKVVHFTDR